MRLCLGTVYIMVIYGNVVRQSSTMSRVTRATASKLKRDEESTDKERNCILFHCGLKSDIYISKTSLRTFLIWDVTKYGNVWRVCLLVCCFFCCCFFEVVMWCKSLSNSHMRDKYVSTSPRNANWPSFFVPPFLEIISCVGLRPRQKHMWPTLKASTSPSRPSQKSNSSKTSVISIGQRSLQQY